MYYVYTLCDPETKEKRYIGCTADVAGRLRRHIGGRPKGRRRNSPLNCWLRSVNYAPVIKPLCAVASRDEGYEMETNLIAACLRNGLPLVNDTAGGVGARRKRPIEEREAIGKARVGIPRPLWVKAKMSATRRAKFASGGYGSSYIRDGGGRFTKTEKET